jgi:hypothetical protein
LAELYARSEGGSLRQGEIITGLVQVRLAVETMDSEAPSIDLVHHPLAVILSQDCDLVQDWQLRSLTPRSDPKAATKLLPDVLLAQMTTSDQMKGQIAGSDIWKRIRQNKDERYQVLEAVPAGEDALSKGLPALGIDFKRYFTIPTEELYFRVAREMASRRCRLLSPYLEQVSTRFCYYQFRVALPADHQVT